jgi:hypothetical protein
MIQRIQSLADEVMGLPPEERAYFLDLIDPQAEKAKPKPKRKAKGKSARATSLADAIKSSPKPREPICAMCGNVEDYTDHSQPSPSYHPFEKSPTAQSAGA